MKRSSWLSRVLGLAVALVLVSLLLPLYALPAWGGRDPAAVGTWTVMGLDAAFGLVFLAPLLAVAALLVRADRPWRRIALSLTPLLLAYSLAALAMECAKPMILERIRSTAIPAPALWNPGVLGAGCGTLLAADLLLLVLWGVALRRKTRRPPQTPEAAGS